MARKLNVVFLVVIAVTALLQSSVAQTTFQVGDALGWTIPSSVSTYSSWAANKNFIVGDILVFNFTTSQHTVAKVSKADYDACNPNNPISIQTNGPATVTLNETGAQYYICTVSTHCSSGQKLAINVSAATSSAPPPSTSPAATPTPAPALAPAPTPSRGPATYTVGDTLGWNVLSSASVAYQNWASNKTFFVGDILVFNFANGTHNVAEVTKQNYNSCNTTSPLSLNANPPVRVTLTKAGEHFFTCTVPGHCSAGQKLAINVTGSTTATPPSSAMPPSSTTVPPPSTAATPPSTTTNPSVPSPTSGFTPPPPPSSATSLRVTGLCATFLSIVLVFLN